MRGTALPRKQAYMECTLAIGPENWIALFEHHPCTLNIKISTPQMQSKARRTSPSRNSNERTAGGIHHTATHGPSAPCSHHHIQSHNTTTTHTAFSTPAPTPTPRVPYITHPSFIPPPFSSLTHNVSTTHTQPRRPPPQQQARRPQGPGSAPPRSRPQSTTRRPPWTSASRSSPRAR
ncbi:hypothetical protein GSI_11171 [Ganoderma sinense ZZ0214-1]|uniref:Uncharacterized protein n=1 Tax=Ganoderma sinense ZZ0214-1 TaxID=1077348 RepID=A0A2G8RZ09_9APHY|nr:hypothetical protein GSI_11171 [Ganoderma sinense ZZ0214-1]